MDKLQLVSCIADHEYHHIANVTLNNDRLARSDCMRNRWALVRLHLQITKYSEMAYQYH